MWYCSLMKPEVIQNTACCIIIQTDHLFEVVLEDRQASREKRSVPIFSISSHDLVAGLSAAVLVTQFQASPPLNDLLFLIICFPLLCCLLFVFALNYLAMRVICLLTREDKFVMLYIFIQRKFHLLLMKIILTSWHHKNIYFKLGYGLTSHKYR